MAFNFQFAFLGYQHNYLARVTRISPDGLPQDDSLVETYGLPDCFSSQFTKKTYNKRFFFNIRGHDFLSHGGQWKHTKGSTGHVDTSLTSLSEFPQLDSLMKENKENRFNSLNMIMSFGPKPGSFFADAYSLKRYKWLNLPTGLEDQIQKNICVKGYGNGEIQEVAMNARGGWIIVFNKGKRFEFGGNLPYELRKALQRARQTKLAHPKADISIHRIYLNHQNSDEYVLIFNDGRCYIGLHASFRTQIEALLKKWATGNNLTGFDIKFISSCACQENSQKSLNAGYYSRRGIFHLSRGNANLALKYLREALYQDENNTNIRDNFVMAIIAVHRNRSEDQILLNRIQSRVSLSTGHRQPPRLPEDNDEDTIFRDLYMWMLEEDIDTTELETRLNEIELSERGGYTMLNGWSYDRANGEEVHEVESPICDPPVSIFELPAEFPAGNLERIVSLELPVDTQQQQTEDTAVVSKRLRFRMKFGRDKTQV